MSIYFTRLFTSLALAISLIMLPALNVLASAVKILVTVDNQYAIKKQGGQWEAQPVCFAIGSDKCHEIEAKGSLTQEVTVYVDPTKEDGVSNGKPTTTFFTITSKKYSSTTNPYCKIGLVMQNQTGGFYVKLEKGGHYGCFASYFAKSDPFPLYIRVCPDGTDLSPDCSFKK